MVYTLFLVTYSEIFKLRGKQSLSWSDCECTVRSGLSMFADVHAGPGLYTRCYRRCSKVTLPWWISFFTFMISFFPNPFMSEYLSMDSSVMESGRIHYLFKGVLFKYKSLKLLLLLKMFIESKQCKPWSDAAYAASDQGLHCLPVLLFWDAGSVLG